MIECKLDLESNVCTILSVVFRIVLDMSVRQEDAAAEPLSGDAVVARLDVILEESLGIRPASDTMAGSPAISRSSKASPATPHSVNTPIRRLPAVMVGPGIRSWPTGWWNGSPDKPGPRM